MTNKKTARELWQEYKALLAEKGITKLTSLYTSISASSTKAEIQNGIDCLKCSDETLNDYLTVIKLALPNIYETIKNNGDFKTHSFNRLFVYNTARQYIK